MQSDLLKDIVVSVAGERSKSIVDLLISKKNVNEFLISKKLGLTINQTRNILYKLGDEGLVSFIRKKDRKKGGWYTYFWTLNLEKSLSRFHNILLKDIEYLKQQIHMKKTERFYLCENCSSEFNEENALLNNYTCTECGSVLQLKDNIKEIAELEKKVKHKEKSLHEVDAEVAILKEKDEKNKVRKLKAEEKKKKKDKDLKKKVKEKEMKKLIKITNKIRSNESKNKKRAKRKKK